MKDAFGHGSNGHESLASVLRQRLPHVTSLKGTSGQSGGVAVASNAAAKSMMSTSKAQAPVHDSMAGRASNPTTIAKTPSSGGQSLVQQRRGITGNSFGTPIPFDTLTRGFRR